MQYNTHYALSKENWINMISCVHDNGFQGEVQQFKHKQEPLSLLSMFVNRIDLDNYKYVLVEISCPSSCG